MKLTTKAKCPYCGFDFFVSSERAYQNQIEYCPSEKGGCDHMMVITTTAHLTAKVLKVEQEADGK